MLLPTMAAQDEADRTPIFRVVHPVKYRIYEGALSDAILWVGQLQARSSNRKRRLLWFQQLTKVALGDYRQRGI